MPIVTIDWLEGRTQEQKEILFEEITKACEKVVVKRENLHIIIRDVSKNDWAQGGVPHSNLDKK